MLAAASLGGDEAENAPVGAEEERGQTSSRGDGGAAGATARAAVLGGGDDTDDDAGRCAKECAAAVDDGAARPAADDGAARSAAESDDVSKKAEETETTEDDHEWAQSAIGFLRRNEDDDASTIPSALGPFAPSCPSFCRLSSLAAIDGLIPTRHGPIVCRRWLCCIRRYACQEHEVGLNQAARRTSLPLLRVSAREVRRVVACQ